MGLVDYEACSRYTLRLSRKASSDNGLVNGTLSGNVSHKGSRPVTGIFIVFVKSDLVLFTRRRLTRSQCRFFISTSNVTTISRHIMQYGRMMSSISIYLSVYVVIDCDLFAGTFGFCGIIEFGHDVTCLL